MIAVAAFNNQRPQNWSDARLGLQEQRQEEFSALIGKTPKINGKAVTSDTPLSTIATANKSQSAKDDAASLASDWGVMTMTQLRELIANLRSNSIASLKVQLPVLGLSFDSNDMGLVFGPALLAFSIFLFKCLRRERRATIAAFEQADKHGELPLAYLMMSLEEVLMRPDNLDGYSSSLFDKHDFRRSWVRRLVDGVPIQVIVAWLPFLCIGLIAAFDLYSIGTGLQDSLFSTVVVEIVEGFTLLVCLVMAIQTTHVVKEIGDIWTTAHARAKVDIHEHEEELRAVVDTGMHHLTHTS